MNRFKAIRHERAAVALAVLLAHIAVAWLIVLLGQERRHADSPDALPRVLFAQIELQPRPIPPGNPDPVEFRPVPVTRPQLEIPRPTLIPIITLDSPQAGPDPAPSTETAISRPGPDNAGATGLPGIGVTKTLKILQRVVPKYPVEAGRRGEQGTTYLLVHVDTVGRPGEIRVARSSGFRRLDDAAILAARKWKFEPFMKEGRTEDAWTVLELRFNGALHL